MKTKCLAVGIILLFVGIAYAPAINFNTVKASQENDLIEVTSQACGITGYKDSTVKLTREQHQNLEQYLVEFRARLNQTTTREEAVPIFKEAVVELDKYGLLPHGMSVERAQKFVIGPYQNYKLVKYIEKLYKVSENFLLDDGNRFCLIYGTSNDRTIFQGCIPRTITGIIYAIGNHLPSIIIPSILIDILVYVPIMFINFISLQFSQSLLIRPFIGTTIFYGYVAGPWQQIPEEYYPANVDIWTIGLSGVKTWTGIFYGALPTLQFFELLLSYYPGANGFIGLRFYVNRTLFYFGFALNVNVSPSHP
jgi:hypothetical protein